LRAGVEVGQIVIARDGLVVESADRVLALAVGRGGDTFSVCTEDVYVEAHSGEKELVITAPREAGIDLEVGNGVFAPRKLGEAA